MHFNSKYLLYNFTIRVLTPIFPMYYYDHSFFFEKFYQTFQKSSTVLSQVAGSTKHWEKYFTEKWENQSPLKKWYLLLSFLSEEIFERASIKNPCRKELNDYSKAISNSVKLSIVFNCSHWVRNILSELPSNFYLFWYFFLKLI